MKKTFSPQRLQMMEETQELVKNLKMEVDLVKLNLDNKCDNRALEKINA